MENYGMASVDRSSTIDFHGTKLTGSKVRMTNLHGHGFSKNLNHCGAVVPQQPTATAPDCDTGFHGLGFMHSHHETLTRDVADRGFHGLDFSSDGGLKYAQVFMV